MRADRLLTTASALTGYALGIVALSAGLPGENSPSWTAPDGRVIWLGAPMVAFLLPTAVLVTDSLLRGILLRGLPVRHPLEPSSGVDMIAIYDAIMARVALFILGVHATILAALLGLLSGRAWSAHIVPLMLGALLIGVGNLLPLTRPNLAIGIRTRRTLADRACWLRTHRLAGHVIVACGAVIMLSALAAPEPFGSRMILLAGPIAFAGLCLLVRLAARHAHA